MNQFTKRLLIFGASVLGCATFALALSQAVSYKPWGVPDSRRDDYDKRIAEIDRNNALREEYASIPKASAEAIRTKHDFGLVHPGETLLQSFYIDNGGDAELTLKVRDTSSERISAALEKVALAPGESTRCNVVVNSRNESTPGVDKQSVTIITNDPFRQTLVLSTTNVHRKELVVPQKVSLGSHDIDAVVTAEFDVFSQTGSKLEVTNVSSADFDTQWVAIAPETLTGDLARQSATVANHVSVQLTAKDYGRYAGKFNLTMDIDGVAKEATVEFAGNVRPPIGFYGPNVDRRTGVNFGTVESDKQHNLYVVVRSRADTSRHIEVLGVSPKELETELTPLKTEGTYRLRISIPKDCPYLRFNLAQHHGYVYVGDPDSRPYASSLPVYGVVGNFRAE